MKAKKELLNHGIIHIDQTPTLLGVIKCRENHSDSEKQCTTKDSQLKKALSLLCVTNKDGLLHVKMEDYACILEEYTTLRDLNIGKLVHSYILENVIKLSLVLHNSLINMYCKCGSIADAQNLFSVIQEKDVFTWTTLIAGYATHGPQENAFKLFSKMEEENVKPDSVTFLSVIKACAKLRNLDCGKRLHVMIIKSEISDNILIRSSLVDMYAKCGVLECARREFEEMPRRDSVSWNAMISGYAQNGYFENVLNLFPVMMEQDSKPDRITLANVLKACAGLHMYMHGKEIHDYIIERKLEADVFLASTLVDMYSKCGSMKDAWKVFITIPIKTDVCFNAMIIGCAQLGCAEDSLKLFWDMESKHVTRTLITYVGALKACSILGNLEKGKQINESFLNSGMKANLILRNALVDMFAKCGSIKNARKVFDEMPERDVISWNVLIAGYAQFGPPEEAFELFERMERETFHPDKVTFLSVIKACIKLGNLGYGKKIHNHVRKRRLESDIFIASTLVDMYAKCGGIDEAQYMFDRIKEKNEVAWNSIIAGYVQHNKLDLAFKLFGQMAEFGTKPVKVTFLSILKACANCGDLEEGKHVHNLIVMNNFETDSFIGNSIVDMYAKCGDVDSGHHVFDGLTDQSLVSWNALIFGYLYQAQIELVFELFVEMLAVNIELNEVTFITMTKACLSPEFLVDGRQIHSYIVESKLESFLYLGNSLIDMYSRCRSIEDAQQVFKQMPKSDLVTWNVMIAGYTASQLNEEALRIFQQMASRCLKPDELTFFSLLKACGGLGSLKEANGIHALIKRHGLPMTELLGNALVDTYAKCGSCEDAREVFDSLPQRKIVSWNAVMTGHIQCGQPEEALSLFQNMQQECLKPDKITFMNVFKACGSLGYLSQAKEMHALSEKHEFQFDQYLENTLIDAYGKCGDVKAAKQVFDGMEEHDVISWNALISAHAQSGHVQETFDYLHKMLLKGQNPNHITYVTILSICNHAGLVEEGLHHFDNISRIHGIDYTHEHYACMIEMLCRVGLLPEASQLTEKMPLQPSSIVWMTILGGCRVYNNLLLAIYVAENIFELQPENAALYVLLSNICSMLLELEDDPKVKKEKDLRDSSIFVGDGGGNLYTDNKTSFGVDAILHAKLHRLYGKLEMIIPL